MQPLEQLAFPWRFGQRRGGLRRLPRENVLPGRFGSPLSSSQGPAAGLGSGCSGRRAVGDFHGRLRRQAEVPLLALRVALVPWDAGAGDRIGAGGRPGDGRPLHVFDADRALHGDCLGRRGRGRRLARSSLGIRGRLGAGGGRIDGMRLAADAVLARQRDIVDSHVGLHLAKSDRPQQPRHCLGRPRTGRRGHRPLPEGPGNQARLRRGPQQPRVGLGRPRTG